MELDELREAASVMLDRGLAFDASTTYRLQIKSFSPADSNARERRRSGVAVRNQGNVEAEVGFGLGMFEDTQDLAKESAIFLDALPTGHQSVSATSVPMRPNGEIPAHLSEIRKARGRLPAAAPLRFVMEHVTESRVVTTPSGTANMAVNYRRATAVVVDPETGRHITRSTAVGFHLAGEQFSAGELAGLGETALASSVGFVGASPVPSGQYACTFEAPAAATLTHEVFGHLLEADNVTLGPEELGIGSQIAPDWITLLDNADVQDPWVAEEYDAFGSAVRPRTLLSGGRVVSHVGEHRVDGSFRRPHPGRPALPRMRSVRLQVEEGLGGTRTNIEDAPLRIIDVLSAMFMPRTGVCVLEIGRAERVTSGGVICHVGGRIRMRAVDLLGGIQATRGESHSSREYCFKRDQEVRTLTSAPALLLQSVRIE